MFFANHPEAVILSLALILFLPLRPVRMAVLHGLRATALLAAPLIIAGALVVLTLPNVVPQQLQAPVLSLVERTGLPLPALSAGLAAALFLVATGAQLAITSERLILTSRQLRSIARSIAQPDCGQRPFSAACNAAGIMQSLADDVQRPRKRRVGDILRDQ